jgi:hypothetical protein
MQTTAASHAAGEESFRASVLAWLISAKFERHLPTYRHQEMLLEPLGLWLSRPLLAKLLRGSAHVLRPLAACLLRELLASAVIQADETPVKYLGHERGKSSTGYLFGYAGDAEHRCLFYDYRASRSRAGPAEIPPAITGCCSGSFSGYSSRCKSRRDGALPLAGWRRREFDEARATTSHPLVEKRWPDMPVVRSGRSPRRSPTKNVVRARREARALVERIFASLEAEAGRHRPSSPLAKAVQYALNRRAALSRFLEDGRIEIDTGLLERSLRGPALGRKNYLFFGSLGGGHTAATLYSVVQSAKLYQLDVTAYLTDALRRLAAMLPTDTSAMRELLPDRWALAHPEHILQARQQESLAALEKRRHRRAGRRLAATGDVD